ncbi:hypothetical protein Bpfe_014957, partial [Biomphalaria pfeifferi]
FQYINEDIDGVPNRWEKVQETFQTSRQETPEQVKYTHRVDLSRDFSRRFGKKRNPFPIKEWISTQTFSRRFGNKRNPFPINQRVDLSPDCLKEFWKEQFSIFNNAKTGATKTKAQEEYSDVNRVVQEGQKGLHGRTCTGSRTGSIL